jgi:nitroreductase
MIPYPTKSTHTDAPIADLLQDRWSPVHFSEAPVPKEMIASLFEAARWAPSCFNEQPWLYVYAGTDDGETREAINSLLVPGNAWAKKAGLLIVSFAKKTFARNGKPNQYSLHDTGAASLQLVLQATALGLVSHQMAGFDHAKAKEVLHVPDEYEAGSMIAVGFPGDPATISPEAKERESGPRQRRKVSEFVFHGKRS